MKIYRKIAELNFEIFQKWNQNSNIYQENNLFNKMSINSGKWWETSKQNLYLRHGV